MDGWMYNGSTQTALSPAAFAVKFEFNLRSIRSRLYNEYPIDASPLACLFATRRECRYDSEGSGYFCWATHQQGLMVYRGNVFGFPSTTFILKPPIVILTHKTLPIGKNSLTLCSTTRGIEWTLYSLSACSLSALITYATLQNTMVFIGIDFLLGNLYVTSYIAMLNARKSMNEREESSVVDVSKVLRSGMFKLGNRTETIDIHAVDNKRTKDDIPLSETTFASNFPNKHDSGRDISSKHLGIKVHQTEERTYDRSD
ncbi:hypothetical protein M413DRAFT_421594 [Hebeloma cylindrosporum]|uniref:DUF6534 domain-containing protein n=1 Tax=Hebeloma cylindrosporum TaxID=76867 RepID=A0A0C3BLG3_HEBCY|nr:hypothetical protein M413DRAFT_421594 [Hebeloma cylindrosporum h7]